MTRSKPSIDSRIRTPDCEPTPELLRRTVHGLHYTGPANLVRLRDRSVAHERLPGLREYALGLKWLERFVKRESLWRDHQAVVAVAVAVAVAAIESEPVDPRL